MDIDDEAKDVTLWLIYADFMQAVSRAFVYSLMFGAIGGVVGTLVDTASTGVLVGSLASFCGFVFQFQVSARTAGAMASAYNDEKTPTTR